MASSKIPPRVVDPARVKTWAPLVKAAEAKAARAAAGAAGIGPRIAAERLRCFLTFDELAELTGRSRMTVIRWERSQTIPDVAETELLAKAFGCSPMRLTGWSAASPRKSRARAKAR